MKVYSKNELAIDWIYLSLFNSVVRKDTIHFRSSKGRRKTFLITNVDSIIRNDKGWFINQAPYKLIRSELREIGKDTVPLNRENLIFVNKNPVKNENSIAIQFNNFYYHDTLLPLLNHDTLIINNRKFSEYYLFNSSLNPKNSDDVKILYINNTKGILGFKTLSGEVWVNETQ